MMLTRDDGDFIQRALELAERGEGHTRPNPPVGAVIVKNGKIIGEGWHKKAGGDHAEVAAIKDALKKSGEAVSRPLRKKGSSSPTSGQETASPLKGATIYVTLEPCSKPGRVGACTDAIIAAGIKRVVYLVPDPNPKNRGKAKRALAKHGIECIKVCSQTCEEKAWDYCLGLKPLVEWGSRMIAPFAKHVTTGLPFVTVKLAMSLDGKICDDWGNAKWISSKVSRRIAGWERARVDAIMVGAETVRRDNPSLLSHNKRNDDLIRVVVTHSGSLPKTAQIFTDGAPNETRVFRVLSVVKGPPALVDATVPIDTKDPIDAKDPVDAIDPIDAKDPVDAKDPIDAKDPVDAIDPIDAKDLKDVLRQLGKMGVMHVFCEGGLKLARALADAGLVDAWISFLAPIVIGSKPLKNALRFHQYLGGGNGDDMESHYELPCGRTSRR